jgi:MoxR-like ATPase
MVRLEDVQQVAVPVLTHRLITSFVAQAEGIGSKDVVRRLIAESNDEA